MTKEPLSDIEKYARDTDKYLGQKSRSILAQYPMVFAVLVLFGSVATFKGLEEMMIRISIFNDYPILLFFIGIIILLFTGSLFKILQKHKSNL
jgi:hypothetical protein